MVDRGINMKIKNYLLIFSLIGMIGCTAAMPYIIQGVVQLAPVILQTIQTDYQKYVDAATTKTTSTGTALTKEQYDQTKKYLENADTLLDKTGKVVYDHKNIPDEELTMDYNNLRTKKPNF